MTKAVTSDRWPVLSGRWDQEASWPLFFNQLYTLYTALPAWDMQEDLTVVGSQDTCSIDLPHPYSPFAPLCSVFASPTLIAHHSLSFVTNHQSVITRHFLFNSRYNHALALFHSRITVMGATLSTSAVSSTLRPPKKRSSTI